MRARLSCLRLKSPVGVCCHHSRDISLTLLFVAGAWMAPYPSACLVALKLSLLVVYWCGTEEKYAKYLLLGWAVATAFHLLPLLDWLGVSNPTDWAAAALLPPTFAVTYSAVLNMRLAALTAFWTRELRAGARPCPELTGAMDSSGDAYWWVRPAFFRTPPPAVLTQFRAEWAGCAAKVGVAVVCLGLAMRASPLLLQTALLTAWVQTNVDLFLATLTGLAWGGHTALRLPAQLEAVPSSMLEVPFSATLSQDMHEMPPSALRRSLLLAAAVQVAPLARLAQLWADDAGPAGLLWEDVAAAGGGLGGDMSSAHALALGGLSCLLSVGLVCLGSRGAGLRTHESTPPQRRSGDRIVRGFRRAAGSYDATARRPACWKTAPRLSLDAAAPLEYAASTPLACPSTAPVKGRSSRT